MVTMDKRGDTALITLRRPEALNALNQALLEALDATLDAIETDGALYRAVVLTGEGKAFAAGADIAKMRSMDPKAAAAYARQGAAIFARLSALPQPVIAAVNGYALGGGCELALACDIRLASETARFGQPEVTLGITPGFGGTQRLPRAIGMARAMELILTGGTIDAREALALSLVSAVYAPEALLPEAMALAERIGRAAPLAVRAAKRAMRAGEGAREADAACGQAAETALFAACFGTQDQQEAMAAFVEKRKPSPFRGR